MRIRLRRRLGVLVGVATAMGALIGVGAFASSSAATEPVGQLQLYCTAAPGSAEQSAGLSAAAAPLVSIDLTAPNSATPGSSITITGSIQATFPAAFANDLTAIGTATVGITESDIELDATGASPTATNLVASAESNGTPSSAFTVAQSPISAGSSLVLPKTSGSVGPWTVTGSPGTDAIFTVGTIGLSFTAEDSHGTVISSFGGLEVSGQYTCYPQVPGDPGTDENTAMVAFAVPIVAAAPPSPPPAPTITQTYPTPEPYPAGNRFTIYGTNLTGAYVTFDMVAGSNVVVNSAGTELTVTVPDLPPNANWNAMLTVTTAGGAVSEPVRTFTPTSGTGPNSTEESCNGSAGSTTVVVPCTPTTYYGCDCWGCSTSNTPFTPPPCNTFPAPNPTTQGYYLATASGQVGAYGKFTGHGYASNLAAPIVDATATPDDGGYWLLGGDGEIFTFGNAGLFGSMGGKPLNAPIVGIIATPTGKGYWEVASDGGIFAFGDAGFFGSMSGKPLNKPVVGMASTPTGKGYWEVASDGGIFTFGDAGFFGSMGGKPPAQPVVGAIWSSTGKGYLMIANDGGTFIFGDASSFGTPVGHLTSPNSVVGIAPTPSGKGYWIAGSDGSVYNQGDAQSQKGPALTGVIGIAT